MNEEMIVMAMFDFGEQVAAKPISRRLWPSMVSLNGGADHHRPFGFSAPQYLSYDSKWVFFFCPEIMNELTTGWSEREILDFVRYVKAHINAHASTLSQDEAVVDKAVFDVMPEARKTVARAMEAAFKIEEDE